MVKMNDLELYNLVKELAEIPGPVGRESEVQKYLSMEWEQNGFETSYDKVGNLYGKSFGSGKRWAIVSHADSIGFIVQKILRNGFIKVAFNTAATNPDARFLAGTPVRFLTNDNKMVIGYFGLRSGHLAGIEGKKKPILFEDMFIDVGVDSKEEVNSLGIDIGSAAVFYSPVFKFQSNIVGPSMDNRIGGAIQCLLAKEINAQNTPLNLHLISTVQEEIGMKGAAAVARNYEYDGVIVLDIGLTGDIPTSNKDNLDTQLEGGPIIVYKDFSIHYSVEIIQEIEELAKTNNIPFQRAVFKNFNTDGVHFFMNGYPTVMLAIPCRYTHTNFETIRFIDVKNTLSLLKLIITV